MRMILLLAAVLGLCACAPLYAPYRGDTGYSEAAVQTDTFDVSFVGNDDMNETQCRKFALMRAAELALLHGRAWFEVTSAGARTRVLAGEVPATVTQSGSRGRYRYTSVTGGYTQYYDRPEAMVRIHLLAAAKEGALDANQIIHDARTQEKVEFKDLAAQPPAR